ncbi:HD domain-containing protein [Granulicella tundricola]|uniref:5'-deoxynucleotidase n=1 Tax=Granulicella tundricola (strain ATCC BAA-1859 / DSM 23138 / MP5ACTX9) TaxID=1198114 RepID=E8WYE7_GRATM|nr:HD domain-containing protein [Granulicella tundricola]ADW69853.1 metal dependent phosphohydrolase [Granulicella tundricola MP5ACTX9]
MQQIIDFILELDKLKAVTRKVKPLGLDRYENSAEHSWQITLLAVCLAPYAEAGVDLNHVVRMLLVHDIGEIDTGDTMVFVEGGWAERKADELEAVKRIFALLPEATGAEFLKLWIEFEAGETAEARFAHVADRAMPVLLNLSNRGQSWRENGISYERVVKRVRPEVEAGCPELWQYLEGRLEEARAKGLFGT